MKLSIITINFNNKEGLQKTIASVVEQDYSDFEYIVIDGGSKDGSLEVITQYSEKMSYFVSELDTGIYNAMNKGIKKAKGEFLLFLNSGDWLAEPSSLSAFMHDVDDYDIVYGDWYLHYSDQNIIKDVFPDVVSFQFLAYIYSLPHQASIIKRQFLVDYGMYDESLRMVSDWKFFLEAIFKWDCRYLHKSIFLCYYNKQGFSSNTDNDHIQKREREMVLNKSFRNFFYIKDEIESLQSKIYEYDRNLFVKILKKSKLLRQIR